jgi:DNA-binding transcriptional regulator LsrR (DeoR family)
MKEKDLLRLIQVSKLYYEENKTQAEIARIMDISRPSVSNLLNKARKEGVVKIDILSYQHSNMGLSQSLCRRFDLKTCQVVTAAEDIHREAARVLLDFLDNTKVLVWDGDTTSIKWLKCCLRQIAARRPMASSAP